MEYLSEPRTLICKNGYFWWNRLIFYQISLLPNKYFLNFHFLNLLSSFKNNLQQSKTSLIRKPIYFLSREIHQISLFPYYLHITFFEFLCNRDSNLRTETSVVTFRNFFSGRKKPKLTLQLFADYFPCYYRNYNLQKVSM